MKLSLIYLFSFEKEIGKFNEMLSLERKVAFGNCTTECTLLRINKKFYLKIVQILILTNTIIDKLFNFTAFELAGNE